MNKLRNLNLPALLFVSTEKKFPPSVCNKKKTLNMFRNSHASAIACQKKLKTQIISFSKFIYNNFEINKHTFLDKVIGRSFGLLVKFTYNLDTNDHPDIISINTKTVPGKILYRLRTLLRFLLLGDATTYSVIELLVLYNNISVIQCGHFLPIPTSGLKIVFNYKILW